MSIPTPEQARQLVEHFGSQRAAAEAIGVSRSTIRGWLHSEAERERQRRFYADHAEAIRARVKRRYDALPDDAYRLRRHQMILARLARRTRKRRQANPGLFKEG